MSNRTNKKAPDNRGNNEEKELEMLLRSIWLNFTTKLEPVSSAKCEPSPAAWHGKPCCAPPRKPLCIFFWISPAENFWKRKRLFLSGRCRSATQYLSKQSAF
jgi:hypothetical protein